jgi:hypothetical protein
MTLIEAMKQALEAMGLMGADLICEAAHHGKKDRHGIGEPCPIQQRWRKAFDALRTAIETAEKQEPVAWDVFELRLYGAPQEKQHRVLWVDRYTHPDGSTPDLDGLLEAAKKAGGIDGGAKTLHVRPLYTTPPAAQWVGLTDEERKEIYDEWRHKVCSTAWGYEKAIEAKIKEKNGV